jgi:hypothetical protein
MHKTITFLNIASVFCLLLLNACTYKTYTFTPQLTNVPLIPHDKEVELYFENEMPKNQVYYEVLGLSAEGNDYNAMLLQLKSRANQAGADAVIRISNSQSTYTSSDGVQFSRQLVKGVGIKYRNNLTYISQYIKSKKVYALNQQDDTAASTPTLLYEAPFHMLGHEITHNNTPGTAYTRFVRELSFDYLLYETHNWTYSTNERNQVTERRNYKDDATQAHLICYFKYNPGNELHSIKLTYPLDITKNVYMELAYTSEDKVSEKRIYDTPKKKNLLYIEKLTYDEQNRIAQTRLYKVEQNQQKPLLQTIYTYYSMDDLPIPKNM